MSFFAGSSRCASSVFDSNIHSFIHSFLVVVAAMTVSVVARAAFATQYVGYVALSTALERAYYVVDDDEEDEKDDDDGKNVGRGDADGDDARRRARSHRASTSFARKIQPRAPPCGTVRVRRRDPWGFPLWQLIRGATPERDDGREMHPRHRAYASLNLLVSSLCAAFVAECAWRGKSSLRPLDASGRFPVVAALVDVLIGFFKMTAWQSVVEYYWHRLMHHRVFYRALHKIHHHYKSPSVWCDLCIHPVEAFGYYVILYSPAFLIDASVLSFLAYMCVMGACGVFDHSGVRIECARGAYATAFHDAHHSLFAVNFAFPFEVMDVVHGTRARREKSARAT